MRRVALGILAGLTMTALAGEKYLKRIYVLNEGYHNYWTGQTEVPVTVGYIDMDTRQYVVFDTIWGARFGVDMVLEDSFLYVTADSFIIKYNVNTLERVAEAVSIGVRGIGISGQRLFVARGELPSLGCCNSYLQVYDKNTLQLIEEADTTTSPLKWHSDDVLILGDSVYVAVNNGFVWGQYVGYIAVFPVSDINNMRLVDLGPDGINPENLMTDGQNVYAFNNTDFTTSSVSTYARVAGTVTTVDLGLPSGCTGSALVDQRIYFQPYFADTSWTTRATYMLRTPISNIGVLDTLPLGKTFYQIFHDTLNGYIWITETDFQNWGLVIAYRVSDNSFVDAFAVGVTPGALAFEYGERVTVGVEQADAEKLVDVISLKDRSVVIINRSESNIERIVVTDAVGRTIYQEKAGGQKVMVRRLPVAGVYVFSIYLSDGTKLTKQILIQ